MSNLVSLKKLYSVIYKNIPYDIYKNITSIGYSKNKNKKYYVIYKGKIIHFGDSRYQDYLIHGDNDKRNNYRSRHSNDFYDDPERPGFWSYNVLW